MYGVDNMSQELKRRTELVLIDLLQRNVQTPLYPSRGGNDFDGASFPQPPFIVVYIDDDEKIAEGVDLFQLSGKMIFTTRADTTDVSLHDVAFGELYSAMSGITTCSGYDMTQRIAISGISIGKVGEFNDNARQAHGDTIDFSVGASLISG